MARMVTLGFSVLYYCIGNSSPCSVVHLTKRSEKRSIILWSKPSLTAEDWLSHQGKFALICAIPETPLSLPCGSHPADEAK